MFKPIRNNKRPTKFSYILILLFIVSQSLATDSGCNMEMVGHAMPSTHANSSYEEISSIGPHAGHDMKTMGHSMEMDANTPTVMSDCCDHDCQCAQHACSSSISIISSVVYSDYGRNNHSLFLFEDKLINSQVSTALFRPPIIC